MRKQIKPVVLMVLWVVCSAAWAGVLPLTVKGKVHDQFGEEGVQRLERWEKLVWDISYHHVPDQLRAVNHFFNQLQFRTDQEHWQQADYWATPVETLASNGGDCEDFAIAKYFTLRQLGVPAAQMRITYVRALKLNEPHMVLTYYPRRGEPLVLDILVPDLLPASQRTDLEPVYSFNAEGRWQAKSRGQETRLGEADDIASWRDLQLRLGLGSL